MRDQKIEIRRHTFATRYLLLSSLILVWLILTQAVALGATYYVDATNGNDSNDGLSPITPWRTIAKVNSETFSPGDSVLFKRGEVWREQLTVPSSGNAGAPITFSTYGVGDNPEINGADVITGWSVYSGNIYVADVGSNVTQLFVDGAKQMRARWPNTGWQNIDADSSNNTSLYSNSLTQPTNYWVGATITMKTYDWLIETKIVVANSGQTITWDSDTYYPPKKNFGFFLEGKVSEIDIPGEWCYEGGKVYLMLAGGDNPANHLIVGSVRDNGIFISHRQHINIENITVKYTSDDGISIKYCDYINVKSNAILSPGGDGILVFVWPQYSHGHFYIDGNNISQTKEHGVQVFLVDHCEITNNELSDIGSDGRSPTGGRGIDLVTCANVVVSGNRIDRVSYCGISLGYGQNITITRNDISNCLLLLSDGGAIKTGFPSDSIYITNNIVRDVRGNLEGTPYSRRCVVGIYLDEDSCDVTMAGNIVFNCLDGIFLHRTHDTTIINNTVYNCDRAVFLAGDFNSMHDNNFYNNIIVCTESDQLTWVEGTYTTGTNKVRGKYDYNLHYNPYRNDVIQYDTSQRYTLDGWRAFSGQESKAVWSDPFFVNTSNHDFHLQSNSPSIDAGKDVGLTQDFEGNPVPQGRTPDIGAYEYVFFPVSVIKNEPKEGRLPLTVSFDGSQSTSPNGDIVSYEWDFGDSSTSTGIKTSHTFTSPGEYTVTLTVTDALGLKGESQTHIIVFEEEFRELPAGCYNNVINPSKGEKSLIVVELQKQARVKLGLYNTRGSKIKELADEEKEAGTHKYYWDGKDDNENVVGSGLYFVHIQAGNYKKTKKIAVVK